MMKVKYGKFALLLTSLMVALVFALAPAVLAADTGWLSPTDDSPGPDNWGFNNPQAAYQDGVGPDGWEYAEAMAGTMGGKPFNVHEYYGYGFSVPSGNTVKGIEVRMDAWLRSDVLPPSYTGSIAVELSWDNGTSWTATGYGTGSLTYGQTSYYKGGASDTWGHTWTRDQINNGFRVRLTVTVSGNTNGRVYLDWVPVRVYYAPGEEPPSGGDTTTITGDVGGVIELTAPSAIALGDMNPDGSPYSASSATPGSVKCNSTLGYSVTVASNDANGKMFTATHTLTNALSVTTGSLSGKTVTTTPQTCVSTSAPGTSAISLSVSQSIVYADAVDTGYKLTLTYAATAK